MARKLVIDDLSNFVLLSSPQLSPDSSKIAYVVTKMQDDNYKTTIYVTDSANGYPIRFYSGGNPVNPCWSPNGQQLLFTSKREMEKDENGVGIWTTQVWGGEPRLITKIKGGASNLEWNPFGTKVYFLSVVGENEEDVKVIDRIPIWFDGSGYTYNKTKHLHVVDVNSGIVSQLTSGDEDIRCFSVSQLGNKIAYVKCVSELNPWETELYVINANNGKHERILSGYSISQVAWTLEDKELIFKASDLRYGSATQHYIYMLNEKNEVIKLTESLDRGCERKHYYDLRSLHTIQPKFFVEGREVYFGLSENDKYGIYRVNIDKIDIDPVISGDFSIEEFSVRKDVIAYTKVSVTKPAEMWVKDYEKERCITRFNNHLLAKIKLSESEHFQFKQRDDSIIEGWVHKPYGFSKNKQYPVVVDVHGGPSSKFGNSLMFEHQMMCANGYGVILINIRGSDGYGQKFRDIRGEYGLWDFEDLKKGIANALKENPWIDPEKLGITGLSYGGFMTNWAITHSDLFKSAVSQNSISNWTSFYGTSDIGFVFANDHVGGNPPTNMDIFIEKSPITYAGDVDTPVLFIHSINDYRCWIDQSIQFFTILKAMGKTTRLALFMEGSHGFRSTSRPSIRKKRIMAILDWFDTYLKK